MASSPRTCGRVETVTYHSPALETSRIGASPDRRVLLYLPPGYDHCDDRYPVVYLLHGYGGDAEHPIVDSRDRFVGRYSTLFRVFFRSVFRRVVTFEMLDEQISSGALPPFIVAQPDGSMHRPHIHGGTEPGGDLKMKGSMYYDSEGTGNFGLAVFRDAVDHLDACYRTVADRAHRAVIGGSMGGYGALLAGILHPDRFSAVAALSPSICGLDIVDITLYVPFLRWVYGKEGARRAGREDRSDILDTCDMIFSPDRPLVPTIERDETGNSVRMDQVARANWATADAGNLVMTHPAAFRDVAVRISCEERDEFGFAGPDLRFAAVLSERGIPHELHIFRSNVAARISAHSVGIALEVLSGLRFCLERIG